MSRGRPLRRDPDAIELPPELGDLKFVSRLLAREKRRRGLRTSDLVFAGMHNVAQHWWCAMYAVLKSRDGEPEFFAGYLEDRLRYSMALGRVTSLPTKPDQFLTVGEDLTRADVEKLFQIPRRGARTYGRSGTTIIRLWPLSEFRSGRVPPENDGVLWKIVEQPEAFDSSSAQQSIAEYYPAYRWWFSWSRYVVGGVPDGVTKEFVYEFKTANTERLHQIASRPIANTQADLYGVFFERAKKRVQIWVRDGGTLHTYEGLVDSARAEKTLQSFAATDSGARPRPPMPFKCAKCDYLATCPIGQNPGPQRPGR